MNRPLFDVEKRVIAEGKTIQVTPDLLLALNRLKNLDEYIQAESEKPISLDSDEHLQDLQLILEEATTTLAISLDDIYKHLDKNYLDAFGKEYCEQYDQYQASLPDEDED